MNLDHDFVQVWKFSEDQKQDKQMEHFFPQIQMKTKKKRSSTRIEHFFPNLRAQMYTHSNYWGVHMWTILKLLGGIQPNYWGGIYPPIPPFVSAPLIAETLKRYEAKWHDSCRLLYNSRKLKRAEKRKKSQKEANDDNTGSLKKSTRKSKKRAFIEACFFCDKPALDGKFLTRKASTFGLDMNVWKAAMKLQDKSLLAKLSAGDLIALNALYHLNCLTSLYNRARKTKLSEDSYRDRMNHGLAFADLVSYIEETRMYTSVTPIFKLSDLVTLYTTRLEQLGSNVVGQVHFTDLKKRIRNRKQVGLDALSGKSCSCQSVSLNPQSTDQHP